MEIRVGKIELQRLAEAETKFECSFIVFGESKVVLLLVKSSNAESCPLADIFFILKAKMSELDILRGMVFNLEVPFSFKQLKLFLIILVGEIDGYDLMPVLYILMEQLLIGGFGQC